jgi:hypothetical protein
MKSFKAEILGPNRRAKFTSPWNSKDLFVVTGANEFSMGQRTDISDYFS